MGRALTVPCVIASLNHLSVVLRALAKAQMQAGHCATQYLLLTDS